MRESVVVTLVAKPGIVAKLTVRVKVQPSRTITSIRKGALRAIKALASIIPNVFATAGFIPNAARISGLSMIYW